MLTNNYNSVDARLTAIENNINTLINAIQAVKPLLSQHTEPLTTKVSQKSVNKKQQAKQQHAKYLRKYPHIYSQYLHQIKSQQHG